MATSSQGTSRTSQKNVETALCCVCGTKRTIGVNYRHPNDYKLREADEASRHLFLKHARCVTCKTVTPHACINDGPGEFSGRDVLEEQNQRDVLSRLRVRRRTKMLEEMGVDVRWRSAEQMTSRMHPLEVHQYRDGDRGRTWFLVVINDQVEPEQALDLLERAERTLDEPDRLIPDPWRPRPGGFFRASAFAASWLS